jgi:hypothetical protein
VPAGPRSVHVAKVGTDVPRTLARIFGALWVIDGVVLLSPLRSSVVLTTVARAAPAQPHALAALVTGVLGLLHRHHLGVLSLELLGALEIAVGVAMLTNGPWRRATQASLVLALFVWVVGEWCGGFLALASGGPGYLFGGPGPALLYAAAAFVALTRDEDAALRRLRGVVVGLLFLGAAVQCLPFFWSPAAAAGFRDALALTPPGWRTVPIAWVCALVAHAAVPANALVVAWCLLAALAVVLHPRGKWLLPVLFAWLLFVWWVGENFGGIPYPQATDVDSAPAWAGLIVPLLLAKARRLSPSRREGGARGRVVPLAR